MTEIISGNFQQAALYPPCLPACRIYVVSGSSSRRRMDNLTEMVPGTPRRNESHTCP